MEKSFIELIREFLPSLPADQEVTADLDLVSCGLDSLGVVSLIVRIQMEYDITIADSDLVAASFSTPERLWQVVERSRAEHCVKNGVSVDPTDNEPFQCSP
jgi:acyl carrier protein